MFRGLSIAAFVIVLVGVLVHLIIFRPRADRLFGADRRARILDPLRVLIFLLTLLFIPQKSTLVGVLRKLIYLLALLCFAVLFATGFLPRLFFGEVISGYWLMLHATAAPVFAVCVALLAVMWAHNCRLNKDYWPWLKRVLQLQTTSQAEPEKHELARKITFWLVIFLALPVMSSIVLSMFPLFGTHWQELLAQLHRYFALVLALAAIVHIYLMILTEAKRTAP
jgi:cytochrome b subunit of formate dehydrogenase